MIKTMKDPFTNKNYADNKHGLITKVIEVLSMIKLATQSQQITDDNQIVK